MIDAIRGFLLPGEFGALLYVVGFAFVVVAYLAVLSAVSSRRPGSVAGLPVFPSSKKEEEEEGEEGDHPAPGVRSRIVAGVFFLGMLIASACFFSVFFKEAGRRLGADRLTATITDVRYTDGHQDDGPAMRFLRRMYFLDVSYAYEVNGTAYTGVEHVCFDTTVGKRRNEYCEYARPRVRDTHDVYVSRSDPRVSYFPRKFLANGLFGAGLLAVAALLFPFIRREVFPGKRPQGPRVSRVGGA